MILTSILEGFCGEQGCGAVVLAGHRSGVAARVGSVCVGGVGGGVNFGDSVEQAEFRGAVREWIDGLLPFSEPPVDEDVYWDYLRVWHQALYAAGFIGLTFPVEYGGRGLDATFDAILLGELGAAGAPPFWKSGYIARVLMEYGTDAQRARYLVPALRSEERWCQGFSEPDAGSDIAALRTRAVRDGDFYVVDGQKAWTSDAKWADQCLLLARTDADVSAHRGISAFVVDLRTPGVTVRPFENVIASFEFAEVFFDGARIPASSMVGEPGDGWRIAMSTVALERGPADNGFIAEHRRALRHLRDDDGACLDERELVGLGRSIVNVEVLALHVSQTLWRRVHGGGSDAESSVDKLLMTATEQELSSFLRDVEWSRAVGGERSSALRNYLWSRAASIYGGTSQVQRNIIASRILGLPR